MTRALPTLAALILVGFATINGAPSANSQTGPVGSCSMYSDTWCSSVRRPSPSTTKQFKVERPPAGKSKDDIFSNEF
jgi:hypothetical protein